MAKSRKHGPIPWLSEASEAVHISRCPPASGPGWRSGYDRRGSRRGAVRGSRVLNASQMAHHRTVRVEWAYKVHGFLAVLGTGFDLALRRTGVAGEECGPAPEQDAAQNRLRGHSDHAPTAAVFSTARWSTGQLWSQISAVPPTAVTAAPVLRSRRKRIMREPPTYPTWSFETENIECSLLTLTARAEFTYPYGYFSC